MEQLCFSDVNNTKSFFIVTSYKVAIKTSAWPEYICDTTEHKSNIDDLRLLQTRYMLGDVGRSLMVGFGKKYPQHIQSRTALGCDGINNCNTSRGLLIDTPNPHLLLGAVPQFSKYSDDFPDVRNDNTSRVDIVNNAAFAGTVAGLVDAPGTWEQCLQGYGVLSKDTSVCNNNN